MATGLYRECTQSDFFPYTLLVMATCYIAEAVFLPALLLSSSSLPLLHQVHLCCVETSPNMAAPLPRSSQNPWCILRSQCRVGNSRVIASLVRRRNKEPTEIRVGSPRTWARVLSISSCIPVPHHTFPWPHCLGFVLSGMLVRHVGAKGSGSLFSELTQEEQQEGKGSQGRAFIGSAHHWITM